MSCLTINPSVWEPTVRGLKSLLLSDSVQLDWKDSTELFYVISNGRLVGDDCALEADREYTVQCRVLGGKGGFGSLLRSFGSQISKNRNQDACRDLSGRRLRNVKAEKRVKEYVEKQAEKDKEKKKKKEEKIQKLKTTLQSKPKHNFNDAEYEAERKRIPDKVFSAVEEGIRVLASKPAELLIATASTSKVSESFDGSVERITENVTTVTTGAVTTPVAVVHEAEKKRKHEDPMINNMGSKRMKGWLGVDDDSEDSEEESK
ncbi:hypothetical protein BV898_02047 [Hypsibius exemplaris]|uniref:SDE2-like domain-containing protein n=1 Tax=Hypsibius exemplaris TaxID=2072580 RepID=A0A1W0X9L8_HYPEX|nr:hypothetical protein BV898_02047 [Hypsibius exemplaris]